MLGQRQELLSCLKASLHEICQICIPSARQPIEYLECPLEHDDNFMPHIRLGGINASDDVFCSKSDCKIIPKKAYLMLLTTNEGISSSRCILLPIFLQVIPGHF